jgi:hypothetical protein
MTKNIQRSTFFNGIDDYAHSYIPDICFALCDVFAEIRKNCNTAFSQASRLLAGRPNCSMKRMQMD